MEPGAGGRRRASAIASSGSKAPVFTLPACAQTIVGPLADPERLLQPTGSQPALVVGRDRLELPRPRPSRRRAGRRDVRLGAVTTRIAARRTARRARRPSRRARARWWRAAASAVTLAIWQPVTKPEGDAVREAEQVVEPSPATSSPRRRRAGDDQARVLIPGRGQPVGGQRCRQRAADDEAEVAAARDAMRPGSAAASSGMTSSARTAHQGAARRGPRGARRATPMHEPAGSSSEVEELTNA